MHHQQSRVLGSLRAMTLASVNLKWAVWLLPAAWPWLPAAPAKAHRMPGPVMYCKLQRESRAASQSSGSAVALACNKGSKGLSRHSSFQILHQFGQKTHHCFEWTVLQCLGNSGLCTASLQDYFLDHPRYTTE